jgi:hypothetical protein
MNARSSHDLGASWSSPTRGTDRGRRTHRAHTGQRAGRYGVAFHIVDKAPYVSQHTKALGVQA